MGDTSTSDTCCSSPRVPLVALSRSSLRRGSAAEGFAKALDGLCMDLAHQVAKDGEGAEKFIEIAITGAENDKAAHRIAMSIANSRWSRRRSQARTQLGPHRHGHRQGGRGRRSETSSGSASAASLWRRTACAIRPTRKRRSCPT